MLYASYDKLLTLTPLWSGQNQHKESNSTQDDLHHVNQSDARLQR